MKPERWRFAAFGLALLAAGCTSIPLSTLWHFRNFSPKTLVELDPGDGPERKVVIPKRRRRG